MERVNPSTYQFAIIYFVCLTDRTQSNLSYKFDFTTNLFAVSFIFLNNMFFHNNIKKKVHYK